MLAFPQFLPSPRVTASLHDFAVHSAHDGLPQTLFVRPACDMKCLVLGDAWLGWQVLGLERPPNGALHS